MLTCLTSESGKGLWRGELCLVQTGIFVSLCMRAAFPSFRASSGLVPERDRVFRGGTCDG